MKYEFWAELDLYELLSRQKRILDKVQLIKNFIFQGKIKGTEISDAITRQHLLAQISASEEKCAKRTKCKDFIKGKQGLQKWYYGGDLHQIQGDFQSFLSRRLHWMASILPMEIHENTVSPTLPPLSILPKGSWDLQLTFTLRKPYLSRDDMDFYILDNPVKKEWVFKVPYVAPSQWKGALRAAMTRALVERGQDLSDEEWIESRVQLTRLFGNEKGVD